MRAFEYVVEELHRANQTVPLVPHSCALFRDEVDPLVAVPVEQSSDLVQGHASLLALDRDRQRVEQFRVVAT